MGIEFGCAMMVYPMNLDTWNSLPADIQQVFDETKSWTMDSLVALSNAEYESALKIYEEAGIETFHLSPEEYAKRLELQKGVVAERIEELNAKGLPGTELWEESQRLMATGCK